MTPQQEPEGLPREAEPLIRELRRKADAAERSVGPYLPMGLTAKDARRIADVLEEAASSTSALVQALETLKARAEPFHRLDLDLGSSPVRPDEWAEICEPLREALVAAGEALAQHWEN